MGIENYESVCDMELIMHNQSTDRERFGPNVSEYVLNYHYMEAIRTAIEHSLFEKAETLMNDLEHDDQIWSMRALFYEKQRNKEKYLENITNLYNKYKDHFSEKLLKRVCFKLSNHREKQLKNPYTYFRNVDFNDPKNTISSPYIFLIYVIHHREEFPELENERLKTGVRDFVASEFKKFLTF